MKNTIYIIRGLPGSGKSTLAAHLVSGHEQAGQAAIALEADQFFVSSNGHKEVYSFDRKLLGAAHDECYGRAMRYLRQGYSVAVANPFTTEREVLRYVNGVQRCGLTDVEVKVIKCTSRFKSAHNVPARAIDKMATRWQPFAGEIEFGGDLT